MADELFDRYLHLSQDLYAGRLAEPDLPPATAKLPPLDTTLLEQIARYAESLAPTRPRLGWALTHTAQAAAQAQEAELFLRSLSAFYLARACNHWTQPKRVQAAVAQARRGFEELHEAGWVAACEWQVNAQAWTRPDFAEAARGLEEALRVLAEKGFTEFVPDCRLALAFAQILIGNHPAALENIRLGEEAYQARGDLLNQARGWLHRASSLRRRGHFEEACERLGGALTVFEKEHALADQAKAHYQFALCHMLQANDLPKAVEHFQKAAELFDTTELDLWRAACINNLGAVYMINGELQRAEKYYQQAGGHFAQHEILGALADNLNDRGKLNVLLGRPARSIEQFKQAEALNAQLGSTLSAAIVVSNLGEAYGQLGRYQDALYHLERAAELLQGLGVHFRLATCEKYMAWIWSRLGQPQTALAYLEAAAAHYEQADQKAFLAAVDNYKAAAFFQQGREAEALAALERSLALAEGYGIRPQAALAKRLLGEALVDRARPAEARNALEAARADFAEMGMLMEQAACQIALGACYRTTSEADKAGAALDEALQLSAGLFPEIDWRAYIELGALAEARGEVERALGLYRKGTAAFRQIRQNFLQPALAGSYLQTPARLFDRIVAVAARAGSARDVLQFIEESKASTLVRNLSEGHAPGADLKSQPLEELVGEIHALKRQLRATLEEMPALPSAFQARRTRELLKQKIEQFAALQARLERQSLSAGAGLSDHAAFDLEFFRAQANAALGTDWVALDYYLTEETLTVVLLTPQDETVHTQPISARVTMALAACEQARRNGAPPLPGDLATLGAALLPPALAGRVVPDTPLLLAPHRRLHQVPWPALQPAFAAQPLVCLCTPGVIPSLHSLTLLWGRRSSAPGPERARGVLVGLSAFGGAHTDLPHVKNEIAALAAKLDSGGRVLAEGDATWANLLRLKRAGALAGVAWMHIASHFSTDRYTGRLSGIVLQDGEIWLDQLRDLAPLPALVSLAACNSNDSFLHAGDERVDLQTTCLIAGASSVVGSAWPVLDQAAAELTLLFFDQFLRGLSPAQSAAAAQRHFIQTGRELKTWAGFICAGIP